MNTGSRREFLVQSGSIAAAALASPWLSRRARANPLGQAVGIQLYTVDAAMQECAAGTVEKLREIGYDVLLRETDPYLVKFEIDCGWMIFAGRDPIDYFSKYPRRFPMIHVKDFLPESDKQTGTMLGAELGHGMVDYKPIFTAAKQAG